MSSIAVSTKCNYCPRVTTLIVPKEGFSNWQEGQFIQNALPQLNVSERETLMTGICRVCQDDIFEED